MNAIRDDEHDYGALHIQSMLWNFTKFLYNLMPIRGRGRVENIYWPNADIEIENLLSTAPKKEGGRGSKNISQMPIKKSNIICRRSPIHSLAAVLAVCVYVYMSICMLGLQSVKSKDKELIRAERASSRAASRLESLPGS